MKRLLIQGKIRFAGVSIFLLQRVAQGLQAFSSATNRIKQMEYNLFDRSIETMFFLLPERIYPAHRV